MRYRLVAVALGVLSAFLLIGYPAGWVGCPLSVEPHTLSLYGPRWELVQPVTCALESVFLPPWLLGGFGLGLSNWYAFRPIRA